jgi:hypothetical protein
MLAVLGCIDIAYGLALLQPLYSRAPALWWPASLGVLYGLPVATWGGVWIAVGLFMFTGMPRRWPDWPQFAAAVAIKAWWAFTAFVASIITVSIGSWGPGAIYTGFALIVLISAGWTEPHR